MWRTCTARPGRQILDAARRRLATEAVPSSAPPPAPVPPQKPSSGFGGFLKFLTLTGTASGGGVVGYAWYDPKFRQQVEENVPYSKDLFEQILPASDSKPAVSESKSKDFIPPPLAKAPVAKAPAPEVEKQPVQEDMSSKSPMLAPPKPQESLPLEPLREDVEKADNAALEVAIHNLLSNSQVLTGEAVKAQQAVVECCHTHTKLLKQAMDDTSDILNKDAQWEAVSVAFKEKENAAQRSMDLVTESKRSIEKLQDLLAESKKNAVTKRNPAIYPATKQVVELTNEIGTANSKVRQAESEGRVLMKYKDLVDKGRKQFKKELESLMPDVKPGSSKKLTEDELNSLIAHAHRRIEQLQRQLAEQMTMERQRMSKALEAQRQEDHTITLAAVADEQLRLQNEFEVQKNKLDAEYLVRQDVEVRRQLSRQASAHSDHIKDVLAVQRHQLDLEFSRELNLKILEEREKFQTEVASWISRLNGIEAAIDARATSEQVARCAQDLWLSCIALNSIIHFGNEEQSESLVPIKKEVETVLNVGRKHPFVETVTNGIPAAALERGVYTEEQLRKRFVKVARISRRLGLVNDSNASLYKYLVSMMHSYVVLNSVTAVSHTDPVDLGDLDNYGLVAHAQHWMNMGDLEMALRFMSQLTGESARAASDWINEARLLLETRQATASLTAYASATGLANTF